MSTEEEHDEEVCRICFDAAPPLISPCRCLGTQRLVHAECLDAWRARSANPRSFYRCDQCGEPYRLRRHAWAPLLESRAAHSAVASVLVVALIASATLLLRSLPVARVFAAVVGLPDPPSVLEHVCGGLVGVGVLGVTAAARERAREQASRAWVLGFLTAWHDARVGRVLVLFGAWHAACAVHGAVTVGATRVLVRCASVLDRVA